MITEHDIPKSDAVESASLATSTNTAPNPVAEYIGVKDGEFTVKLADGTFDQGGWVADELTVGPMGERAQFVLITKRVMDAAGNADVLTQTVPIDELNRWQVENPSGIASKKTELSSAEIYTKRRLEKLFAPPKVVGEHSENSEDGIKELDYKYLFEDDEIIPNTPSSKNVQSAEKKALPIDDEDLKQAAYELRSALGNQRVAEIIQKYNKEHAYKSEDLVGLVRRDAGLRYELGAHFVDLLDTGEAGGMPYRITHDDWKTPSHGGYEDLGGKVRSREYVAKLVLSMLDGTFDVSADKQDPIDIRYGDGLGQHRTAARQLLRYLSHSE